MAKRTRTLEGSPFIYTEKDIPKLKLMLSQAAKTANTRLREIEKAGLSESSKAYQYVERKVFDNENASSISKINPAFSRTRAGQIKFNTNFRKMDLVDLQTSYSQLQNFLNAKTSSAAGTRNHYKSIADALNEYMHLDDEEARDFTAGEWGDIWNATKGRAKEMNISSDLIIKMVRKLNLKGASAKQIVAFIEDTNKETFKSISDRVRAISKEEVRALRHSTETMYI